MTHARGKGGKIMSKRKNYSKAYNPDETKKITDEVSFENEPASLEEVAVEDIKEEEVVTKRVACGKLNFRAGAGYSEKVISILDEGTVVELVEKCDGEWVKIKVGDTIGYCMSRYLAD